MEIISLMSIFYDNQCRDLITSFYIENVIRSPVNDHVIIYV
jgi:hypothetical protein